MTTTTTYSPVVAFSTQSREHSRHWTVSLSPVPSQATPTGNMSASHTVQSSHAELSVVPWPLHCWLRNCPALHDEKAHAVHSDTSVAVVPSQLADRYLAGGYYCVTTNDSISNCNRAKTSSNCRR